MKKNFLPAVLANLTAALSEILLMSASAWLIVSAAAKPPLSALSIGITLVRTAGISRAALRYADRYFSHKTIFDFLDELREELFKKAAKKLPLKSGKFFEGELLHNLIITASLRKDLLPKVILPISTALLITFLLTIQLQTLLPTIIFCLNILFTYLFKVADADDTNYREKILDFYEGREELKIYSAAPAIKKLNSEAKKFSKARQKVFQIRRKKFLIDKLILKLL